MPGPSNKKGKRRSSGRKVSATKARPPSTESSEKDLPPTPPLEEHAVTALPAKQTLADAHSGFHELDSEPEYYEHGHDYGYDGDDEPIPAVLSQRPFIEDPGNGPRVRDAHAFLKSYFAQPPSMSDPMCAEFAQVEILEMLQMVLPPEMATILWYNKSRAKSRVCPACQRLYTLGQILAEHIPDDGDEATYKGPPPQKLLQEQGISGLCSPVCFVLASFGYPEAIKSAWGRMSEEMDERAWEMLNCAPSFPDGKQGNPRGREGEALGLLVRMTRLHDLGLAQLCLPDVDFDENGLEAGMKEMIV